MVKWIKARALLSSYCRELYRSEKERGEKARWKRTLTCMSSSHMFFPGSTGSYRILLWYRKLYNDGSSLEGRRFWWAKTWRRWTADFIRWRWNDENKESRKDVPREPSHRIKQNKGKTYRLEVVLKREDLNQVRRGGCLEERVCLRRKAAKTKTMLTRWRYKSEWGKLTKTTAVNKKRATAARVRISNCRWQRLAVQKIK